MGRIKSYAQLARLRNQARMKRAGSRLAWSDHLLTPQIEAEKIGKTPWGTLLKLPTGNPRVEEDTYYLARTQGWKRLEHHTGVVIEELINQHEYRLLAERRLKARRQATLVAAAVFFCLLAAYGFLLAV